MSLIWAKSGPFFIEFCVNRIFFIDFSAVGIFSTDFSVVGFRSELHVSMYTHYPPRWPDLAFSKPMLDSFSRMSLQIAPTGEASRCKIVLGRAIGLEQEIGAGLEGVIHQDGASSALEIQSKRLAWWYRRLRRESQEGELAHEHRHVSWGESKKSGRQCNERLSCLNKCMND